MLSFRTAAASHVGLVRSHNEDSAYAAPGLVVVADGMGGAAAGEVASATATRAVVEVAHDRVATRTPREALARGVARAAEQIGRLVEADPHRAGMGTTFTALMTDGSAVALAHLGDSRAYLLRGPVLVQLSDDHTLVQSLVDAGRLTPAGARRSQHRHIVMRSLGGGGPSAPDLLDLDLVVGDRLLVCSDGLSDLVDDDDLALVLQVPGARGVVDLLVAAALDAGGTDNITCVVVDVVEAAEVGGDPRASPAGGTLLGAAASGAQPLTG